MSKIDKLIGQEQSKPILKRQAWIAGENPDQTPDPLCLLGTPSTGKTEFARAYAHDAGLPLLELQPQAIPKVNDLMSAIAEFQYEPPNPAYPYRISILIDETHQISRNIEQSLLKALETKDRLLVSEDGRELPTDGISWIFCTTDRGDLFDALDSRAVKIRLRLYSKAEIAQIVKLNFPLFPLEACEMVAHYCSSIPREALAFARDMTYEAKMTGERHAESIARLIASQHQIDQHGMTQQRLDILTALGFAPVSRGRLCAIAQCKDAELQKFTLPPLLARIPDRDQPLITVSSKGYTITPSGLAELDLRGINNNGTDAIPKSVRSLFHVEPEETVTTISYANYERKA